MKIDFNATFKTIYDSPATPSPLMENAPDPEDPDKTIRQEVTLRSISVNALLSNESGMTGKVKLDRYDLAKRIQDSNGTLEISVKESNLLQKLVGKQQNPLVVGQAMPMLEGEKPPSKA